MPEAVLLDEQQRILNDLKHLGLEPMAEQLEYQFLNPNIYSDMDFTRRLQSAVDAQQRFASERRFYNIIRRASLQYKVDLSAIRADEKYGPRPDELLMLSELKYAAEFRTVYISGPTGSGKTLLANAACISAARRGMSVKFYRMSDLLLFLDSRDGLARQRLRDRLAKFKILVLDDYGINKISAEQSSALLSIVDERYNRGATIVTSQVRFSAAADVISDSSKHVREALVDRLFPANTCVIELTGSSKRGSAGELRGESL